MRGYRFALSCPDCGGPLDHVESSSPAEEVTRAVSADAVCMACRHTFTVCVSLVDTTPAETRIEEKRRERAGLASAGHYPGVFD
jgi:uncharacterized protein YbaR (Trm112 family)